MLAVYPPTGVLSHLVGGQPVKHFSYYDLGKGLDFTEGLLDWRSKMLQLIVSPAQGKPFSRKKITKLTGLSDRCQRRAGLLGERNELRGPVKKHDYLEPGFKIGQRARVEGDELVIGMVSSYDSLPVLKETGWKSKPYRSNYYFHSEEEAANANS